MSSGLYFVVVLCLISGLWTGTNASSDCESDCCKKCPPGWTHFGSKCYSFHFGPKDWVDAERDCLHIKGNLVSIHNDGEYKFVYDMIKTVTGTNTRIWIGGSDIAKEGVWLWTDGSYFGYNIFPKGQPDNGGNKEHCLEMNWRDKPNDVPCHYKKSFICSMSL